MNKRFNKTALSALLVAAVLSTTAQAQTPIAYLQNYQQQGIQADPQAGKTLWYRDNNGRSCTSCHGDSPAATGKHQKTKKPIKPMALSVNAERYRKGKKIEKWFKRNCKWTLGRTCSNQEKADVLAWLQTQ